MVERKFHCAGNGIELYSPRIIGLGRILRLKPRRPGLCIGIGDGVNIGCDGRISISFSGSECRRDKWGLGGMESLLFNGKVWKEEEEEGENRRRRRIRIRRRRRGKPSAGPKGIALTPNVKACLSPYLIETSKTLPFLLKINHLHMTFEPGSHMVGSKTTLVRQMESLVTKKCNHSETGLRVELTIGVVLRVRGRICLWSKEVVYYYALINEQI